MRTVHPLRASSLTNVHNFSLSGIQWVASGAIARSSSVGGVTRPLPDTGSWMLGRVYVTSEGGSGMDSDA